MTSVNIYRVRFIQSQRYAINISAPSAELAEFFAEEIPEQALAAPFEAIGDPYSADWQSKDLAQRIRPTWRRCRRCPRPAPARRSALDHRGRSGQRSCRARRKPACRDRRGRSEGQCPTMSLWLVAGAR